MKSDSASRHYPCKVMAFLLLFHLGLCGAHAAEFPPATQADEVTQSRIFEAVDGRHLLLACLAVIQDIKFQVIESELEPGLIVAMSPTGHTITVNLQREHGQGTSHRLRLSAVAATNIQPDFVTFYQDFFTQLDRELFKDRSIL